MGLQTPRTSNSSFKSGGKKCVKKRSREVACYRNEPGGRGGDVGADGVVWAWGVQGYKSSFHAAVLKSC